MFLLNLFSIIIPFIMIGSVILIIISFSIKNKKISIILFKAAFLVPCVFIFIFMGLIVPYSFLIGLFDNYSNILFMLTIIFTAWLFVSLIIQIKNRFILSRHTEKEIYIRDVNVNYSPAVLSYLIFNSIETKKDLSATLLNLCTHNVLEIQKDKDGKVVIKDLKNTAKIEQLSSDEKYAYQMLTTGITSSKIRTWKNKVKEEYEKYKFSKPHKTKLSQYLLFIYIIILIVGCIFSSFITNNIAEIFIQVIVTVFFAAWEMTIFSGINSFLNKKNEFNDTYTSKGALEYNRWKKFEKFINDYTLVNEKTYENIVILGKYLSYSIALGINKKCDKELYDLIDKTYSFNYGIFLDMFNIEK